MKGIGFFLGSGMLVLSLTSGCAHSSHVQLKNEKENIDNMLQEVAHGKMSKKQFVENYVKMIEGGKFEE